MNAGFKPAVLQAMTPKIQSLADDLLDRIVADGKADNHDKEALQVAEFDFMRSFARPLPTLVICGMLGIDARDLPGTYKIFSVNPGF